MNGKFRLVIAIAAVGGLLIVKARSQPAPQPPERTYILSVTGSEANVIGGALSGLPYRDVAPLLLKLQAQIKEQDAKPAPAASDPPKPRP